jgi:hypothetical protein
VRNEEGGGSILPSLCTLLVSLDNVTLYYTNTKLKNPTRMADGSNGNSVRFRYKLEK